jgi:RNA polymerase nonessential primary-like sigma factor
MTASTKTYQQYLTENIRLIQHIANSYRRNDLNQELVQIGRISLYDSYCKFKPEFNVEFMDYAKFNIKYDMMRYLNNKSNTIKSPKKKKEYDEQFGPLIVESGDLIINDDNDSILFDLVPVLDENLNNFIGDDTINQERIIFLKNSLKTLKPKYREILEMKFGLINDQPMTFQQISEVLGCSKENIRQLYNISIKKLKENVINNTNTT